jgi:hypothetical protein
MIPPTPAPPAADPPTIIAVLPHERLSSCPHHLALVIHDLALLHGRAIHAGATTSGRGAAKPSCAARSRTGTVEGAATGRSEVVYVAGTT